MVYIGQFIVYNIHLVITRGLYYFVCLSVALSNNIATGAYSLLASYRWDDKVILL